MVKKLFFLVVSLLSCSRSDTEYVNLILENKTTNITNLVVLYYDKELKIGKLNANEKKSFIVKLKGDMHFNMNFKQNNKIYKYSNIGYFTFGLSKNNCLYIQIYNNKLLYYEDYNIKCKNIDSNHFIAIKSNQ